MGTLLARKFYLGKLVMEDLPPAYAFQEKQDWYMAYDAFGLDHYVLYHGLGESIRHTPKADVLIVGNSQVGYGFPKSALEHGKLKTGLSFYNLGFGYAETSKFIIALIEKHDLRPKFVIANVPSGDGFFKRHASEFGQKVMEASRWEAWKTVFEWSLTWRIRNSGLNERLPNWRALQPPGRISVPRFIYCRSISTGSWAAFRERQSPKPVGALPIDAAGEAPTVDNETLSIALEFKRALAARGANLILTQVPSRHHLPQQSEVIALAAVLDVPFIGPVVDGLVTRDGGHLNDESADRFGTQLVADFGTWLGESDFTRRCPVCDERLIGNPSYCSACGSVICS